jgi:hypothetical protein
MHVVCRVKPPPSCLVPRSSRVRKSGAEGESGEHCDDARNGTIWRIQRQLSPSSAICAAHANSTVVREYLATATLQVGIVYVSGLASPARRDHPQLRRRGDVDPSVDRIRIGAARSPASLHVRLRSGGGRCRAHHRPRHLVHRLCRRLRGRSETDRATADPEPGLGSRSGAHWLHRQRAVAVFRIRVGREIGSAPSWQTASTRASTRASRFGPVPESRCGVWADRTSRRSPRRAGIQARLVRDMIIDQRKPDFACFTLSEQ